MITMGVDVGSTTTKAVVLDGTVERAAQLPPSGALPAQTAAALYGETLARAGLQPADVAVIAVTGYGRRLAGFGDIVLTEIKACAAGVRHRVPAGAAVHTIIDVGGQDTKVLALGDDGEIEDFSMNDKCAAGTGRFLEVLAQKLGLSYAEFVAEALQSETLLQMNATCAVFAESEVVGLLARGEHKRDIAAAAHHAVAARISSMIRRVARRAGYWFVGGGALNQALVRALQEALNAPVHVPPDAQFMVALGAAVAAAEKRAAAGG